MKATVRMKLTLGFLGLLSIGSVASLAILAVLSRSIDELKRVVTVSDVIEHKALEMRFDMLAMSDAMRGFLINPANRRSRSARRQADDKFEGDVESIKKLAPQGEILRLVQEAARDGRQGPEPDRGRAPGGDRLFGTSSGPRRATAPSTFPLRQKQEAIIADIEKETIRLKQAALQSAESSYCRGPRDDLDPGPRGDDPGPGRLLPPGAQPGPSDRPHGGVDDPRRQGRSLGRPRVRRPDRRARRAEPLHQRHLRLPEGDVVGGREPARTATCACGSFPAPTTTASARPSWP